MIQIYLLLAFLSSFFNDPSLSVSNIPLTLLKEANAVVRSNDKAFIVKGLDDVEVQVESVITVLNNKASHVGNVSISYHDGSEKITALKIEIYDARGRLIKKVKKK